MNRPRLLFLSHRLPFPPDNGASIRTYNVLFQLAQGLDVTAICFDRKDRARHGLSREQRIAALCTFASAQGFPIPQEHSRLRLLWDHVRSVATQRPYVHYVHQSAPFERALRKMLAEQAFDLVHFDSIDLQRFLPLVRHLPVVCTNHNVESVLLARRGESERGWRGWYMRHQARLAERAEVRLLPQFDLTISVSDIDTALLGKLAPGARVVTIPNGVDTDYYAPANAGPRAGCVFVGGTTWFPNRDGLEWFASDILPRMRQTGLDVPVTWVGRVTDAERAEFAGAPGLEFTGYVDDIRPQVHAAACFIAPLRVGGGTRVKILDAWALGMPVVATSIACEGLDAVHEGNILIADDAESFVREIARVLAEPALAARLGAAGRALVERRYSWSVLGVTMRSLYRDVLARRTQAVASGSDGSPGPVRSPER